ncbi:hypothetical protein CR152_23380 [Massilia violaceinigra]|uniref:Uncharacterized protein n=1 Tax=Massilia violaceinigra TaxID=2045208 RepID=A0A2D2DQ67_9BURK|nr:MULTISPECIES: hypothetical protein [Massilia]ATQ77128.1 hypothetical protein CR152_23380 [Massilia violaceinigra]MDQ1811961.1 hypothetical protein [Massilia sp. CCM 9210]
MQILNGNIAFNRRRNEGPRRESTEVVFPTAVTQATALLIGFDAAFSPRDDHHFGNLEIRLETEIDPLAPRRVNVHAVFGLRDWSGDWDDHYEGEVFFSVVAE